MSPQNIRILFYIGLLLAIIWHIVYLSIVIRYHENMYVAYERARLCKSHQVEGETVRYACLKSFTRDRGYYIKLAIILSVIITLCILGIIIYLFKIVPKQNNASSMGEIAQNGYNINNINNEENQIIGNGELILGICAIIIAWIDTILISTAFNDISKTNATYKKNMNVIIAILQSLHTEYPMYKSTSEKPYPDEVEKLYKIILNRWVNKYDEATIEDGKSSLIELTDNKQFDIIYEYLRFDSTYVDHSLLKTAYNNYCTKNRMKSGFKCMTNVNETLNYLQTYLPNDDYKNYLERLKSYIIYGIVLLSIFLFPLFHFFYKIMGAGLFGFLSIIAMMIASSVGYYMYIYREV